MVMQGVRGRNLAATLSTVVKLGERGDIATVLPSVRGYPTVPPHGSRDALQRCLGSSRWGGGRKLLCAWPLCKIGSGTNRELVAGYSELTHGELNSPTLLERETDSVSDREFPGFIPHW
ncbi:hypothetical protein IF1G_03508 [Cordyceps javanica]|uniref:Uncharacterized protein n=1 Tax=Cordyceps javanica TaxID=43265 RepID=A0A545V7U9_9HYPO|nr:hypothetical protein IF1G_03508 [Cordyceps javanica]